MAKLHVAILRDFLGVLRAALDDEHVDPDIARRIVERVIYGGVPSYAEVEQRIRERKAMVEQLAREPADTSWIRMTGRKGPE